MIGDVFPCVTRYLFENSSFTQTARRRSLRSVVKFSAGSDMCSDYGIGNDKDICIALGLDKVVTKMLDCDVDELDELRCACDVKGCIVGYASVHMSMCGKLGWRPAGCLW